MNEQKTANLRKGDEPQHSGQEKDRRMNIDVQVERFPMAKPKFTKETWDSGEGGGEGGEGEG
jgi:hypothetical protein